MQQRGLAATGRSGDSDVLATFDREARPTKGVDSLARHGIVLPDIARLEQAHGASARSVAAIGPRPASQAGYNPASAPVRPSTPAAMVIDRGSATKNERAAGSPGKLVSIASR